MPISFATRRDDVSMYTFLKKGLASMKDTDIHEALISKDYANPEMNVKQFLSKSCRSCDRCSGHYTRTGPAIVPVLCDSRKKAMRLSECNHELNEKAYVILRLDCRTKINAKSCCPAMHRFLSRPHALCWI